MQYPRLVFCKLPLQRKICPLCCRSNFHFVFKGTVFPVRHPHTMPSYSTCLE